ncbi:MAG: MFS transporter [Nitrospirae bacterium]|nr:MFS transporter [Nitrospirota bacterium]
MGTPFGRSLRPRLHRVILATGWVSLFTDLGSEMIYPILPLFITVHLGAGKLVVGIIEGLAEGIPLMVRYFAGHLSDRVRSRVPIILGGYGVSSVAKPLIGLAATVPQVLGLRLIDKIGKGFRGAPRDALVSDLADADSRGRAFGYTRAMDHLGAVGGGLLAFLLLSILKMDVAGVIKASAIPGVLALFIILLFVRENSDRLRRGDASVEHPPSLPSPSSGEGKGESHRLPVFPPGRPRPGGAGGGEKAAWRFPDPLKWYVPCLFFFALAGSTDAFLLLRARELGFKDAHLPLLWAGLHLVKAATNLWGGRLSDRWGRRRLLVVGWFLYGSVYAGFAVADGPGAVLGLLVLYGFFFGLTEGASRAVVADWVPPNHRGRAFGWIGAVEGAGLILASLLGGYLWDTTQTARWTFAVGSFFSLVAALGWVATLRIKGRPT